jgi:hypothetical protein
MLSDVMQLINITMFIFASLIRAFIFKLNKKKKKLSKNSITIE